MSVLSVSVLKHSSMTASSVSDRKKREKERGECEKMRERKSAIDRGSECVTEEERVGVVG